MMFHRRSFHAALYAALALCAAPSAVLAANPKLYLEVRGVRESDAAKVCKLREQAQAVLLKALAKRPEVTTELGKKVSGAELEQLLKARKLAGYAVMLRIARCGHQVLPPAKGKVYRVLMVELEVAIDAEKLPSGQMALAGEGSAQVGTEVSQVKDKERQQLLQEALAVAVTQAVDRSVLKLAHPGGDAAQKKGRRTRRGRR